MILVQPLPMMYGMTSSGLPSRTTLPSCIMMMRSAMLRMRSWWLMMRICRWFFVHFFKHLDEALEAPEVDAGFWLVEEGERGAAGEHHGDLDAFHFAAGKAVVELAVDIITGAEADFAEIIAGFAEAGAFAAGKGEQVDDLQAFKRNWLLEGIADAEIGAIGDGPVGDILAVEIDAAAVGLDDAADDFHEGAFAAAIGTGDGDKGFVDLEIDIDENIWAIRHAVRNMF